MPAGKSARVKSVGECCQMCLDTLDCKVWVTTDNPVDFCWLKAWHDGAGAGNGVVTNRYEGSDRSSLRWSGLACQCDATCSSGSSAGTSFAAVVLVAIAIYLGAGAVYRYHTHGARGWAMLPNRQHLAQLRSLFLDGLHFCRAGFKRSPQRQNIHSDNSRQDQSSIQPVLARKSASKGHKPSRHQKQPSERRKEATVANDIVIDTARTTTSGGGGRWVHVPG
eukprot:SAG31_NODE_3599_length_4085_cov_4.147516_2_plen_222_part_00